MNTGWCLMKNICCRYSTTPRLVLAMNYEPRISCEAIHIKSLRDFFTEKKLYPFGM